ncbi:MAG: energy transducer TonB [Terriglobia bacterium]
MKHMKLAFLIFAYLSLVEVGLCEGKDEAASAEALISRAIQQEGIWREGAPPMLLHAEIQVPDTKGASLRGDYTLTWISPSRWREEFQLGKFERLRIGADKGYWEKNSLSYQPEIVFQLDTMLHLKDALRIRANQTIGNVKNHENAGGRERCTEVKWPKSADRILCFDEASGVLNSVEYAYGGNDFSTPISRIEYGGFNRVGERVFPFEIRALNGKKDIGVVRILKIEAFTVENPELFEAPTYAEFWAQCDNVVEPEVQYKIPPKYPLSARKNGEQGKVVTYAVIETDGSLSHLAIIHKATPDLEAAALQAVSEWHYKPAKCGETPIRFQTSIQSEFSSRKLGEKK